MNEAKQQKTVNPSDLNKDVNKLAAGKIAARIGGPVVQSVVTAEDLTKQAFGVGLFENSSRKKQEITKEAQKYILKRLGLK